MFRTKLLSLLALSIIPSIVLADCQLGERCDYFNNDIVIAPPYLGAYKCTLEPSNHENITVEIHLLTASTIADPTTLVLNNNNKVGVIKVMPHSQYYLKNAFRIAQTTISFCDETSGKDCHIQPSLMCERIDDFRGQMQDHDSF